MANDLSLNVLKPASAKWISGRVETLLSHFFKPDLEEMVEEAAMVDWIKALSGFSQEQIGAACEAYIAQGPSRRPAPSDIRGLILSGRSPQHSKVGQGCRETLTYDERQILEMQVLPTARRWLGIPGLRHHAVQTLNYWGEHVE